MNALLTALQNPALYGHPVHKFQVIETHISWVLLTGDYAYKIKKPVDLGFLDFSTLEKRHHYCLEELRLNQRLAPYIYLEVVAFTGTEQHPTINGDDAPFEYAVKMKQFAQSAQMDRMLARGELSLHHMDQLAQLVAQFHAHIAVANENDSFGTPGVVREPVEENFSQIGTLISADTDTVLLRKLEQWCDAEFQHRQQDLVLRKRTGFIRECHGDMHLRNIAVDNTGIIIFDGIEFSDKLRWIDVMSEIAFVVMDLHDRQQTAMAARFLNHYLEITGDYAGLAVLRYYLVYRALVRAKVDCIRAHQPGFSASDQQQVLQEFNSYLELAHTYTHVPQPCLITTHGLSGSGKTYYTQALLESTDFIRLRSDIERKRLHGLSETATSDSGVNSGIYTTAASQRTYAHLLELTEKLLVHGWSVVVDATFIRVSERDAFCRLAQQQHVPFVILDFQADISTLRQRIHARNTRQNDASEATLAVLDHQLKQQQPLTKAEKTYTIRIDTDIDTELEIACDQLLAKLKHRIATQ